MKLGCGRFAQGCALVLVISASVHAQSGQQAETPARAAVVPLSLGQPQTDMAAASSQPMDTETLKPTTNLLGWPAAPLTEPISTDRPDFTETPDAVPYGHIQLESGYTFSYDKEKNVRVRSHTAPEFLLRVGIVKDFEIRIGWEGYTYYNTRQPVERQDGRTVMESAWDQGSNDLSLGSKIKFLEQDGLIPHLGLIAEISVPSGSANLSSGDVDPGAVLPWAYDLTDRWSVAGNIGFFLPSSEDGRFYQTTNSLTTAYGLTDRLGVFIEYYGLYPNTKDTDCAHTVDGGSTYLITDNLQLDWRIGFGLNEEADDFLAGVGLSWRF
jgi:hypothetical protein